MKLLKKIIFPLFSVFLIYRTIELMIALIVSQPAYLSLSETFITAFLLALFITGVFAFLGFAYPTSRLLVPNYYKLKNPNKLRQVYNILGVQYFKLFLLLVFWGKEKNRKKYFDGTRSGLQNFMYQSQQSEFGHLCAFVSILLVSIVLLVFGYVVLVAFVIFINIIGNLYPILLQRHHRIRIEKLTQSRPR